MQIVCLATADPNFDPIQAPPIGWPAHKTIWWVGGPDAATGAVSQYRVDQQEGAGDWQAIATVGAHPGDWDFSVSSPRLDDLANYSWRITAIDAAGNESDPIMIGPETICRALDAPNFAAAFDAVTRKVTIAAA